MLWCIHVFCMTPQSGNSLLTFLSCNSFEQALCGLSYNQQCFTCIIAHSDSSFYLLLHRTLCFFTAITARHQNIDCGLAIKNLVFFLNVDGTSVDKLLM